MKGLKKIRIAYTHRELTLCHFEAPSARLPLVQLDMLVVTPVTPDPESFVVTVTLGQSGEAFQESSGSVSNSKQTPCPL